MSTPRHSMLGPPRLLGVAVLSCGLLLLLFQLGLVPAAYAATIDVPCQTSELIDAITTANNNGEADTLNLAADCTYVLTAAHNAAGSQGNNGLPPITSTLTISGNGATIQRDLAYACPSGVEANDFRLFYVTPPGNLTLHGLTLRNGCGMLGGAIYNDRAHVTVVDSQIMHNHALAGGGGVTNNDGHLSIVASTLFSNTSSSHGGGIDQGGSGSVLTITQESMIVYNAADVLSGGGGIWTEGGSVTVENSAVLSNTAYRGGGINLYGEGTVLSITQGSLIAYNIAERSGGGIENLLGKVTLADSRLVGNQAEGVGGGLNFNTGLVVIVRSDVIDNYLIETIRTGGGGGIGLGNVDSVLHITDSRLLNNRANSGAFLRTSEGPVVITGSCISGNNPGAAIDNLDPNGAQVDATGNWWGVASGPGPVGPGGGDKISDGVTFLPFRAAPPDGLDCPTIEKQFVFIPMLER